MRNSIKPPQSITEPCHDHAERKSAEHRMYQPFPVDALPEAIRGYVMAAARAIGCDPAFVALPLLAALAAAIGNTRRSS